MKCPLKLECFSSCYWTDHMGECAFGRTCNYCGNVHTPADPVLSYYAGHELGCQTPKHQVACADLDRCLARQAQAVAIEESKSAS